LEIKVKHNMFETGSVPIFRQMSKGKICSFGGLEIACWPLVPNFTGSNPAEAVGFFKVKKSTAHLPSEGK
jgi:hypothetical protein